MIVVLGRSHKELVYAPRRRVPHSRFSGLRCGWSGRLVRGPVSHTDPAPSLRLSGFHRPRMGHAECFRDFLPRVASGSGFVDEFCSAGRHGVHPFLERGEGFDGFVDHRNIVTRVDHTA